MHLRPHAHPFHGLLTRWRIARHGAAARLLWVGILALTALAHGTRVDAGDLSHAERRAIRAVVAAQLEAIQADDAATAFAYASPDVQHKTRSPERFMEMVRRSYQPVYRPRAVFFQYVSVMDGVPAQRVLLMDARGAPVMAVFPMQRQADGSWRVAGCMLYRDRSNMM